MTKREFMCQRCGAIIYVYQDSEEQITWPRNCHIDQGGCGKFRCFRLLEDQNVR